MKKLFIFLFMSMSMSLYAIDCWAGAGRISMQKSD